MSVSFLISAFNPGVGSDHAEERDYMCPVKGDAISPDVLEVVTEYVRKDLKGLVLTKSRFWRGTLTSL